MRKLTIPDALQTEFATVKAIWNTSGKTRRVDSLLLSWVKYEKQLRHLFSFFVFQHPKITKRNLNAVIIAFSDNRNLCPETCITGIEKLGVTSLPKLLGNSHANLWSEITRIKKYRNKLMHGQLTGQGIKSPQLEQDVIRIINWISAVAQAADATFGYDGLRRNTYAAAKASPNIHAQKFPFSTTAELKTWLSTLKSKG